MNARGGPILICAIVSTLCRHSGGAAVECGVWGYGAMPGFELQRTSGVKPRFGHVELCCSYVRARQPAVWQLRSDGYSAAFGYV